MLRNTTIVVGVAALTAALSITLTGTASTPKERTHLYQGKTAIQWHRIAVQRRMARDHLRSRLGDRTRELRTLKRHLIRVQPFTVTYAIKIASTAYGVSERDMNVVASCESGHSAFARNGQYRGVFQEGPMFERGRFGQAGFSVWDPLANALTAAETVSREGWSQWECKP